MKNLLLIILLGLFLVGCPGGSGGGGGGGDGPPPCPTCIPPVAPSGVGAEIVACLGGVGISRTNRVRIFWTDNSDNEDGFRVHQSYAGDDCCDVDYLLDPDVQETFREVIFYNTNKYDVHFSVFAWNGYGETAGGGAVITSLEAWGICP